MSLHQDCPVRILSRGFRGPQSRVFALCYTSSGRYVTFHSPPSPQPALILSFSSPARIDLNPFCSKSLTCSKNSSRHLWRPPKRSSRRQRSGGGPQGILRPGRWRLWHPEDLPDHGRAPELREQRAGCCECHLQCHGRRCLSQWPSGLRKGGFHEFSSVLT